MKKAVIGFLQPKVFTTNQKKKKKNKTLFIKSKFRTASGSKNGCGQGWIKIVLLLQIRVSSFHAYLVSSSFRINQTNPMNKSNDYDH